MNDVCSDAQSRLQRLGEALVSTDSLSDSTVLQLLEALEVGMAAFCAVNEPC